VKLALAQRMRETPTPAEAILCEHLRTHRMAGLHFRRQHVISGCIADFYCHAARLVVEVDGQSHQSSEARLHDAERDRVLRDRGLRLLRVSNEDVFNRLPDVLARICREVAEAAA
jgi:very-short-patch-repair endonuclease